MVQQRMAYLLLTRPPSFIFGRFFLYCGGVRLLLFSSSEGRKNLSHNIRIFVHIALFPRAEKYLNIIMKIYVVLSNVQLKSQRPLDSSSSSFECDEWLRNGVAKIDVTDGITSIHYIVRSGSPTGSAGFSIRAMAACRAIWLCWY